MTALGVAEEDGGAPYILSRAEHPISRKNIDTNAVKVLYRLHRSGYRGLMVGGSVRDLMLGRRPKDFDVATDARPHEVRRLFRNSRIIGRRFRLAHVFFHDGIVEVSTFRRDPDPEERQGEDGDLLITDDNVFGTAREDAFRRDFTVNALFYDIADFSVIDYVGGVRDLEERSIRVIGDPDVRFQEDPVRMLRACEMAGRLDFGIDPATQEGIHRHRKLLERAAPARVTEEIVDLLRCGAAEPALRWMLDLGLIEILLPEAYALVAADDHGLRELSGLLPAIDRSVQRGDAVSDGGLLAALLLPGLLLRRQDVEAVSQRSLTRRELRQLVAELAGPLFARFMLSRQRAEGAEQALMAFLDLGAEDLKPAQRLRLARRASFRDALWLLALMVEATGEGSDVLEAWRDVDRRVDRPEPADRKPRRGRGRSRARRRRRR